MPTYNNAIPQPTDQINNSQDQILQNFQTLSTALIGVNTAGLLESNLASSPVTAANQIALFSRVPQNSGSVPTPTSVSALRKPSSGSIVEFSDLQVTAGGPPFFEGWTRLPSGLLMKWLEVSVPAEVSGFRTRTFNYSWPSPTNFPAFSTKPYVFQLAPVVPVATTLVGTSAIFVTDDWTDTTFSLRIEAVNILTGNWAAFNCFVTAFGPG